MGSRRWPSLEHISQWSGFPAVENWWRHHNSLESEGMNVVFVALLAVALVVGAITGNIQGFSTGLFDGVKTAVKVAIGLTGALALWLGLVRILEKAGALASLSRAVAPVVRFIFPGLPADHPAIAAVTLNIA